MDNGLKAILLFNVKDWSVPLVKNYLTKLGEYKIRFGFSHIVAILDELDEKNLPDSEKEIFCVRYDKESEAARNEILVINGQSRNKQLLNYIASESNNIIFDLRNFGFYPERKRNLIEIYDSIFFDGSVPVLQPYQCRDLLQSEKLDDEVKKYLLDIYILIASGIQILVSLQDKTNFLKQYAGILSNIFIVGAQIEKSIFLIAKLDDSLNYYKEVTETKKVISTFLKKSKGSQFELAKKLRDIAENFEPFSEKFRTPEAHKKGRIFALISNGHYGTLVNEILSYRNLLSAFFIDVIKYLH